MIFNRVKYKQHEHPFIALAETFLNEFWLTLYSYVNLWCSNKVSVWIHWERFLQNEKNKRPNFDWVYVFFYTSQSHITTILCCEKEHAFYNGCTHLNYAYNFI